MKLAIFAGIALLFAVSLAIGYLYYTAISGIVKIAERVING